MCKWPTSINFFCAPLYAPSIWHVFNELLSACPVTSHERPSLVSTPLKSARLHPSFHLTLETSAASDRLSSRLLSLAGSRPDIKAVPLFTPFSTTNPLTMSMDVAYRLWTAMLRLCLSTLFS
jgi:hypothetical protein